MLRPLRNLARLTSAWNLRLAMTGFGESPGTVGRIQLW